jgi:hypothetical protein
MGVIFPSETWLGFFNWFTYRTYHASREYAGYIFLNPAT